MKASDYIVSFLAERGINVVFGYIGGMITHLVDSLDKSDKVQFVQTYHEQTAAIAAEGYALESGKFGVAICTSGPGVTNMMTGIADAYFGSIPVIYITGQVNSYEYKYEKPIRQQGFQETDVVSIVEPITKYSVMVDNAENLRYELEKAVHIATTGRKGPVVLDLPMDISRAEIEPDTLKSFVSDEPISAAIDVVAIKSLIENSKRPMLLLGAGCVDSESKLNEFIIRSQIPVITSLMGRGTSDEMYEYFIGMVGSYGNRSANMAVAKSDLLIVLGSRLDTRQTGAMIDQFLPDGKIIHVDIDNNELEYHRLENSIKVNTTVESFLTTILSADVNYGEYTDWHRWTKEVAELYNQDNEVERFVENKAPYRFVQALNKITKEGDVITADIGQNQMWSAQTVKLKKDQKFVTSGGLAPMGFSLPVAIGIAFANLNRTIYCLNGDGGFHMACQSLLLISQYGLNIKVVVLNNNALGMITQFQHLYFNDRMAGTTAQGGYIEPDIAKMAESYRLPYISIDETCLDLDNMIPSGCCIVDYHIKGLTTVSPKLEYNKPISKPIPLLPDEEYNEIMNRI